MHSLKLPAIYPEVPHASWAIDNQHGDLSGTDTVGSWPLAPRLIPAASEHKSEEGRLAEGKARHVLETQIPGQ